MANVKYIEVYWKLGDMGRPRKISDRCIPRSPSAFSQSDQELNCLLINSHLANSADPDKRAQMIGLIWVYLSRNGHNNHFCVARPSPIIEPRQANLVLVAYASRESRGTFRQKARSLAPLNGWACAVTICHDGMLEDTNSLGAAQLYGKISSDQ